MGKDIAVDGQLVSKWLIQKFLMEMGVNMWAELNWCGTKCSDGAFINVMMHVRLLQSQITSWPPDKIKRVFNRGNAHF
jgi:hypothetical protein